MKHKYKIEETLQYSFRARVSGIYTPENYYLVTKGIRGEEWIMDNHADPYLKQEAPSAPPPQKPAGLNTIFFAFKSEEAKKLIKIEIEKEWPWYCPSMWLYCPVCIVYFYFLLMKNEQFSIHRLAELIANAEESYLRLKLIDNPDPFLFDFLFQPNRDTLKEVIERGLMTRLTHITYSNGININIDSPNPIVVTFPTLFKN